jgi:hypothetical protein
MIGPEMIVVHKGRAEKVRAIIMNRIYCASIRMKTMIVEILGFKVAIIIFYVILFKDNYFIVLNKSWYRTCDSASFLYGIMGAGGGRIWSEGQCVNVDMFLFL